MHERVLDLAGLQLLIEALAARGFTVMGPTVRSGAIVTSEIRSVDDLPRGWGDDQGPGRYRLRRREDEALFGFATGPQSAKGVFFPTHELLWRGTRTPDGRRVGVVHGDDNGAGASAGPRGSAGPQPPYALIGVRACDLSALGIHDRVLVGRRFSDAHYATRRSDAFVVAVACSDPGGTCFCVSMGTGPKPVAGHGAAFDLSLTELLDGGHRFLVEVGSERGAAVLDEIGASVATSADVAAAREVTDGATRRMGRRLDTDGIKDLLYTSADSPRWDDVASRCLACTNCTMVCPTCFCTTVEDVSDLSGDETARNRVWDSCFSADFSYIHGGVVRGSTRSRYRQWMTHKLASWQDQFGSSGCVGCGRCIAWCPAAIDITAEAAALRGAPGSHLPDSGAQTVLPAGD